MADFEESIWSGMGAGLNMLWAAVTANPWIAVLLVAIVVGALWLQLTPSRRRRRR